jgi:hypothetical protein
MNKEIGGNTIDQLIIRRDLNLPAKRWCIFGVAGRSNVIRPSA